jgi:hypothetical protein
MSTRRRLPNHTTLIRFPARRSSCVWLLRENGGGWLVLVGSHGWHHGDHRTALDDARWLSANLGGLPIRRSAA